MRMTVKTSACMLLAGVVSLLITSVHAEDDPPMPPLPHAFYGKVDINGSPAPVGTVVEARGEGVAPGHTANPLVTTVVGEYSNADPFEPKLIVQEWIAEGAKLTFYVNGVSTGQTAEWHSGEVTELDLSVIIE